MPENQRLNMPATLETANLSKPIVTMKCSKLRINERIEADFSKAYLTYYNRNSRLTSFPTTGNVPWAQSWIPELLKLHEKDGKVPILLDGEIVCRGGIYIFIATRIMLGF